MYMETIMIIQGLCMLIAKPKFVLSVQNMVNFGNPQTII